MFLPVGKIGERLKWKLNIETINIVVNKGKFYYLGLEKQYVNFSVNCVETDETVIILERDSDYFIYLLCLFLTFESELTLKVAYNQRPSQRYNRRCLG